MEQIAAEARAGGTELGNIKRRIDGKGIAIFTLESGGTIRDTGKDIFFSSMIAKRNMPLNSMLKRNGERCWS